MNNNTLYFPGEWESHDATWITWPCRLSVWDNFAGACQAYADVINAIAPHERVYLIINPEYLDTAKKLCTAENVIFVDTIQADDSWSRDTSPIFLKNEDGLTATCWKFNAWGKKFSPYHHDAELSKKIAHYLNRHSSPLKTIEIPMVLEGGSVHSNGEGTLLTTKECLLNANRNPHLTQNEIETQLKKALHVEKIIWLDHGLDGDVDTDGHIDNAACFIDSHSIMIQSCDDSNDLNFNYFQQNKSILQNSVDSKGKPFTLHEIPQPPRAYIDNARVPLSYINFYFANNVIILPTFNSAKTDDQAKEMFKDVFPKRDILPVYAWPILQGGGGIHCITMQQPKV